MEFNPTNVCYLWSVKSIKDKHLNQHDRIIIENSLNINLSFKAIALKVDKDCTTISKEIRHNMVLRDISCYGRIFNNCIHCATCQKEFVCDSCKLKKPRLCRSCKFCRDDCNDFIEEVCPRLSKPPYVCNGCDKIINRNVPYTNKCIMLYRLIDSMKKDYLNQELALLLLKLKSNILMNCLFLL